MAASTLLHNNLILMCKFSKRFSRGYKLHCAPITQDTKLAISRRQTWYRAPSCINWFRLHSRYSLSNCWMTPFHGDEDCETPRFPHNGVTRVLEMHSSSSVTMTAEMMRLRVAMLMSESSFVFSAMFSLLLSNAGSAQVQTDLNFHDSWQFRGKCVRHVKLSNFNWLPPPSTFLKWENGWGCIFGEIKRSKLHQLKTSVIRIFFSFDTTT